MLRKLVILTLSTLTLAGCAMSGAQKEAYEKEQARLAAEIALRQGEPVGRICPRRSDEWKAFGNDAFLVQAKDKWYRVALTGTCDPNRAIAGIVSRGSVSSSCLERGDVVLTSRPREGQRCSITSIHDWDMTVQSPTPASQEAPSEE